MVHWLEVECLNLSALSCAETCWSVAFGETPVAPDSLAPVLVGWGAYVCGRQGKGGEGGGAERGGKHLITCVDVCCPSVVDVVKYIGTASVWPSG